ncbi:MAG: NAD(P)H-dependent oxidoreductase [Coriobacteriales bacterium]|jgi:flavodoxin|nr:NAD(P)H-dependent oxidoreductase [Coriobacteriales bacterium]
MGKRLVVYFSASGVTRKVAESLADAVGADIYEIKPQVPYTKTDLDWQDDGSRSSVEMRDKSFRPPMADSGVDIAAYDVVFVGFPIWWYVAPTIVNTFLESHDFSGKTIVPFATSGSSGIGETVAGLKPSVAASTTIMDGKMLNGSPTSESLSAWVESLGI